MGASRLTADELGETVRSLVGRGIGRVVYYDLAGSDGPDGDWDFDEWHDVVMGVELTTVDGAVYSASWDDSFSEYGMEMVRAPMAHYLRGVGKADGPRVWEVTGHPRWRGLLAGPVVGAEVLWSEDPLDGVLRAPVAIRLGFAGGEAWLVAGRSAVWPPDGRFHVGTDDVIVGFSREFVERLGLG